MNGLLCVNKSTGMTSRDVVNLVQRRLKPIKVGHAGTLDPLATGVLVLLIGKATRLTEYVQRMPKTYRSTFRLGATSDTEDIEGNVTELPNALRIERAQIERALPRFVGSVEQMPPAFSALKVNGRRAYALARAGKSVELKARTIEIHSLSIDRFEYPDFELTIECGSGTYVRSLGRDIARSVNSEAIMTALNRTAIGPFTLENAIASDELRDIDIASHLTPMSMAVASVPSVKVTDRQLDRVRHGISIELSPEKESLLTEERSGAIEAAAIGPDGQLVAILVKRRDGWGPSKSFISG